MTWASHLLCQHGTVALEVGDAGSAPADEGATMFMALSDQGIDEPVFMKESLKVGPFHFEAFAALHVHLELLPRWKYFVHALSTPIAHIVMHTDDGIGI